MNHFLTLHSPRRTRAGTPGAAGLVMLVVAWLASAPAVQAAEPSQKPLLSRVGVPPAPNMMITVDDSGSMQVNFIPEGSFTLNGKTVTLPSQYGVFNQYFQDIAPGDPTHSAYSGSSGSVTAVKTSIPVYQMQMRSASVNRIYYDPNVLYKPWYKPDGTRMSNASVTAAYWDVTNTGLGTINLTQNLTGTSGVTTTWWTAAATSSYSFKNWYPGLYYVLSSGADPTLTSSYTQYDINVNGSHAPAVKGAKRTDCAGTRCTRTEERQNFANWFQYYRSRILLTKAALSEVIGSNPGNVRFGLASINHSGYVRQTVKDFSSNHREDMLTKLQGMSAYGGTPLKAALDAVGAYFEGGSNFGNPWATSSSSSEVLSCRRSYNILMTDGYYNGDPSGGPGNVDATDGSTHTLDLENVSPVPPDKYTAASPYSDSHSSTLADYAMKYYVKDLQPSVLNKVMPITADLADPAYWQHLSQFTVGLGVVGTLPAANTAQKTDTLAKLTDGSLSWPNPGVGGDSLLAPKIDDLWHAAVNTRGDFFLANNSSELTEALNDAVGRAAGASRVEAGVAASGKTASAGTLKFVPSYQPGAWWGDVKAFELESQTGTFSTTPTWSASSQVPAPASRKILTWTGSAGALFDTTLTQDLKDLIAGTATQDALINYVRGDTSNEGGTTGKYRQRAGKTLPDFVNSTPLYVKGLVNMGYTWNNYSAFVASKRARSPGVVFVGGNGGMLHGFRDTDGQEVVAYAPKSTFGKLNKIAQQNYGSSDNFHQFFVDGPLLETDAYIATGGKSAAWTNILIGALGAGGTGLFALDVTDPAAYGTGSVMWEISSADDPNIGYIFNKPVVGRLNSRWFAFFGNGANSSTGRAVLFAMDLETRALQSITLDKDSGGGAMGVTAIIDPSSKEMQGAYVGDLKGNLWRVEFAKSSASSNWKVGFNGYPLYIAKSQPESGDGALQPITVAPALVPHYMGGTMVLFGTGKLIDSADADSAAMQSFYGVWDKTLEGESSASSTRPPWDSLSYQRSELVKQTMNTQTVSGTDSDTGTYYTLSSETVDWSTQRGWYMDLTLAEGQRVLYNPTAFGEFVVVFTVVPGEAATQCDTGDGTGYNFFVPALTGGMFSGNTIDTNGDGLVDTKDSLVAGWKTGADGSDVLLYTGTTKEDPTDEDTDTAKVVNSVDEETLAKQCINNGCIKSRVWRQILNPPQP